MKTGYGWLPGALPCAIIQKNREGQVHESCPNRGGRGKTAHCRGYSDGAAGMVRHSGGERRICPESCTEGIRPPFFGTLPGLAAKAILSGFDQMCKYIFANSASNVLFRHWRRFLDCRKDWNHPRLSWQRFTKISTAALASGVPEASWSLATLHISVPK